MFDSPIYVPGHNGLVGSAIVRRLRADGATHLLLRTRREIDLRRQVDVERFFAEHRPQYGFLGAAKVGGIEANRSHPAQFLRDNLQIQTNIIDAAQRFGTRKLLFLGSSCIYPRLAQQPMSESSLLEGPPEPTNQWYTVAKIAGVKLCEAYRKEHGHDFISVVPTNLYGPQDHFDPQSAHVVPGLLRRAHEANSNRAPELSIWGSGYAQREFMHVDDCADALVFLIKTYSDDRLINVGSGEEISIGQLAHKVCGVVGYSGGLVFDITKPDGMPRKLLDSSRILAMGWRPRITLDDGLSQTYQWFLNNVVAPAEALIAPTHQGRR